MQQGLGGYAANVKANPAQRGIAFDQADLESEVSCAKRCGISAGSRAEYRKVKGVRSFGNFFYPRQLWCGLCPRWQVLVLR